MNSTIYIPSLKELNDPFDCQIDIDHLFKSAIDHASSRGEIFIEETLRNSDFKENWKQRVSGVGVYSVSIDESILHERLMWSHYAEKHTGVCIKYSNKFDDYVNSRVDGNNGGAVIYEEKHILEEISNLPRAEPYFSYGLTRLFLFTKQSSWKYEKEGRFVVSNPTIWKLPDPHIEGIYFGVNSSVDDVNLVMKLAKSYSGCNKFYKAKREGYYNISFEKISA